MPDSSGARRGIVGLLDGAKPRDILMTRDDVDAMFAGSGGVNGADEE